MRHVNAAIENWIKTDRLITTLTRTMTLAHFSPADLALTLAPESLGFQDTSELMQQPLPWIGQARAETAARFGLSMEYSDYNLFVPGQAGRAARRGRDN